jgi:hypothetical protein
MKKLCSVCDDSFEASSPIKYCSAECRNEALRSRQRSFNTRWASLQRILQKEKCDPRDPLWKFSHYASLIGSGICVFCESPIEGGIALDRENPSLGHTAANCPARSNPVCGWCNGIRSNRLTVDQMFRLKPLLVEFRKENKCQKLK